MKRAINVGEFNLQTLNIALDLSLEWGENWLQPVNARLMKKCPQLGAEDSQTLNEWCIEVREFAFAEIEKCYALEIENKSERALETTRRKYPQINAENLARLYNQGMYYAWRG